MNKEQLYMELLEKMHGEQDAYRSWLLEQPLEEILIHTYEFTAREDILIQMESMDLPAQQAAALLESPSPLADIYKDFRNVATDTADRIQECIEWRANHLLEFEQDVDQAVAEEVQREMDKYPVPVYPHDGAYARDHGELEQYRASLKENMACRDAIEAAIRENFDGMSLSGNAAKSVLAKFGAERVTYVLAATLQEKYCDARFSRNNQAWAASIPVHDGSERRLSYLINSHSGVLDGFVKIVRRELEAAREQPEKKPSIRAQLAQAKASQTEKDAAQRQKPPLGKDMDAR